MGRLRGSEGEQLDLRQLLHLEEAVIDKGMHAKQGDHGVYQREARCELEHHQCMRHCVRQRNGLCCLWADTCWGTRCLTH
jgi:hypothetical protein